jgi:hypothetical protein
MKVLFVAKSFGRYHFFKSADARTAWIETLPEWEQKHVESWEVSVRSVNKK